MSEIWEGGIIFGNIMLQLGISNIYIVRKNDNPLQY